MPTSNRQGDEHICTNYIGITLMQVAQTAFIPIMTGRLTCFNDEETYLSEEQGAFRVGNGPDEYLLGMDLMIHQQLQR